MMQELSLKRKARNIIFTSSKFAKGLFAGFYRSVFRGPGLELEEVRGYQPGDDIKTVDWAVSARRGELHTKVFREERSLPVFIIFDVSASMDFGSGETSKREVGAMTAAALAYAAVYNSDRIGAVLFSEQIEKWIKPGGGTTQASRCVKDFLEYPAAAAGSDLNSVLKTVYGSPIRRGICFIISDFKFEVDPLLLWRLKTRHDMIALRIIDRNEAVLPVRGLIPLRDMETGDSSFVFGKRPAGKNISGGRYIKQQEDHLRKYGADVVDIFTDEDPFRKLYHFFRKRVIG